MFHYRPKQEAVRLRVRSAVTLLWIWATFCFWAWIRPYFFLKKRKASWKGNYKNIFQGREKCLIPLIITSMSFKTITLIFPWYFWNSQVLFFDSSTIKVIKLIPNPMDFVDITGNIHFGKLKESFHLPNLSTDYANQFNFFGEINNYIKGTQLKAL